MKPRVYFRLALLLPLIYPYGVITMASLSSTQALLASGLGFGGAGYAILAAILWMKLGKLQTPRQYLRLALLAPWFFIPLQAISWIIWCAVDSSEPLAPHNTFGPLFVFAAYIVLVGYSYLAVIYAGFRLLKRVGVIKASAASHPAAAR